MADCKTEDYTWTIVAGTLDAELEVGFDTETSITIHIKITDATGGGLDVTGVSTDPTGPSCGLDSSKSPVEGTVTFTSGTYQQYSIDVDHDAPPSRLDVTDAPTTTVVITTKPSC